MYFEKLEFFDDFLRKNIFPRHIIENTNMKKSFKRKLFQIINDFIQHLIIIVMADITMEIMKNVF
jgi:hypothetical protein